MNAFTNLLIGIIAAAESAIIFRGFFSISQYPLYHLPFIIGAFFADILLVFFIAKKELRKLAGHTEGVGVFALLYLPVLSVLIVYEKTFLGLPFFSDLPWYAVTLYPMVIFLPMILSIFILMMSMDQQRFQLEHCLVGFSFYLFVDLYLLWQKDILYSAAAAVFAGFILMAALFKNKVKKIEYVILGSVFAVLLFTQYPAKAGFGMKAFVREYGKSLVKSNMTQYGELNIHEYEGEYTVSINHSKIIKYPDSKNLQEIVHSSLLQYPWAENVLVIGGWSGIIREVLRYPNIKSVYWAGLVPESFDIVSEVLPITFKHKEKLRLISSSDPRNFLRKVRKEKIFDVIIVFLPDPVNILLNRYYTHEFFQEISSVLTDNSMISTTVKTGEEALSRNHRLLSSSIYHTLQMTFPNTLEILGTRTVILASYNRNFTTSHLALSEFLKSLNTMPSHISSSLLRYKLKSSEMVKNELSEPSVAANTDLKPVSFSYTFREILYSFGLMSPSLENIFDNVKTHWVYLILLGICVTMLKILGNSTVERKLQIILALSSYIFALFVYDMTVSLQSNSGRIFRLGALIWMGISLGFWTASTVFKAKDPRDFVSILRVILMMTGVFLIILPGIYEIMLIPPPPVIAFIITFCGGVLFGSIRFLGQRSCEVLQGTTRLPGGLYMVMVAGMFAACLTSVIVLPALGIADMLPAAGIISLGCVTLISI